jgi:hypothetical protein
MDTSASARVLGLIRQTLWLEAGEMLYLLAGIPRRWLESGKRLEITQAVSTAAQANLRVNSELEKGRIVIELEILKLRPSELAKVRLRVPHPSRQKMTAVELDGKPWIGFDPEEERVEFTPRLGLTEIVVRYSKTGSGEKVFR